jgi:tRNA threonylcarbamoyladenosine biosynthesis protein TsaB
MVATGAGAGQYSLRAVRVLAVDTTTERESAAVAEDGVVRGEVRLVVTDEHSRRLLPAIAFLLESLGIPPGGIDAYAVTTGPGSFTGLRVGLSTVQGLALATGARCLGVSALDVLAERIRGEGPRLVALVDAYRQQVFGAVYDRDARLLAGPACEAPERFLERVGGPAAWIGNGAERYRDAIAAARPDAVFPSRSLFLAATLARLAAPRLAGGEGVAPSELRPQYLREVDIRKPAT